MKKIAIAAALAMGVGALGLATLGNAPASAARVVVAPLAYNYGYGYRWYVRPKKFNAARYVSCFKKVYPQRLYGAAALFAVDKCYIGDPAW
jgi:hypothetical protein